MCDLYIWATLVQLEHEIDIANWNKNSVRNGIWTHAHIRGPDLKSGALDRSATLTIHKYYVRFCQIHTNKKCYITQNSLWHKYILHYHIITYSIPCTNLDNKWASFHRINSIHILLVLYTLTTWHGLVNVHSAFITRMHKM